MYREINSIALSLPGSLLAVREADGSLIITTPVLP